MKIFLLACLLVICGAAKALAWSGPGHMVVAAIAYRDLSPEDRKAMATLLSHHYNQTKWMEELPTEESKTMDGGIISFMGASKWPDEIKYGLSKWNHREWHFVDYPITPPDFAFTKSPAPGNDIIFGIDFCLKQLKDPKTLTEDKACWLAWLIHLVGDVTQPLHCCALVNAEFPPPDGDRGGNLIFVKATEAKKKGIPLHKMVDDAMGASAGFHAKQLQDYVNEAIRLGVEHKRETLPMIKTHPTPEEWSRESWDIAVKDIYLRGKLPYSKDELTAPVLPEGYTKNLKVIANQQVALAGYRLADLIREVVKAQGAAPAPAHAPAAKPGS